MSAIITMSTIATTTNIPTVMVMKGRKRSSKTVAGTVKMNDQAVPSMGAKLITRC